MQSIRASARGLNIDLQHGGPVRAHVAVNAFHPAVRGEKVYIHNRELFGDELILKF